MKHIKKVSVVKATSFIEDIIAVINGAIEEIVGIVKKDDGNGES